MELLPTIWFILIAVLWLGYLFLEGFDLGVGMLLKGFSRDEKERRVLLNTIGPVWDGNEVWLLTAGGATFAAFPMWYASLFSALYLPLTLALLALILRAVAIEYRGKGHTEAWRNGWTWCLAGGSAVAAFCVGAMLALTTTGLPLNENGDNIGGPFAWVNIYAIIGGLGVVGFCLLHGLLFISLKTDGEVRVRARDTAAKLAPVLLLPLVAWVIIVQVMNGGILGWILIVVAAALAAVMWMQIRGGAEKPAFIAQALFLAVGVTTVFQAIYPNVLPSTIDESFSLTVSNASSSGYTLTVMLVVAIVFVPIVLVYQIWSYSVFAKRLKVEHIPPAHQVPIAIRSHHQ
ncbi:cytochrome d ubiquinol oxidase subunit II [Brevibacterium otitidis]|uniref:Cytochrome d ubiquinol oxidase subunit II n=1 Tax=Brevibacterium otitidis TaxID=53364 RepID=A0ABV5X6M6_9MICO|nr:cytochrome d ubiquinol oxidase subunit II [Brevibacterium otitidis]